MLFQSSIRRELSRSFGATVVILITIVVTIMLIRTLGQASKGSVNPSEVSLVLAFTILGNLSILLALSLFIACVGTLSRIYRDSEMVIWLSCGQGLGAFFKPMLGFAAPTLLLISGLSLFAWPWSNQHIQELVDRFEKRGDLERVTPGQFQESANGQRVFFIDKASTVKGQGNNVFIATREGDKQTMTTALHGHIENKSTGEKFLILNNGEQLIYSKEQETIKLSEFSEYGAQIGKSDPNLGAPLPRTIDSWDLITNPSAPNSSELAWRIGLTFTAFNLIVISLALASVNPRAGKSAPLLLALFTFIAYFNLLNIGKNYGESGKGSPYIMLVFHLIILTLATLWLMGKHNNWRVFNIRAHLSGFLNSRKSKSNSGGDFR
jgi:lipopolysaccharide export system permease protein